MSATGAMLAQVTLSDDADVSAMAWSCQRFFLEDQDQLNKDNCDADSNSECLGAGFRPSPCFCWAFVVHTEGSETVRDKGMTVVC